MSVQDLFGDNWRKLWTQFRETVDPLFPQLFGEPPPRPFDEIEKLIELPKHAYRPQAIGHTPLYYVARQDYSIVEANPQPTTPVIQTTDEASVISNQLRFLLSQAPMQDAPKDRFSASRSVTRFAYVHPKTWLSFANDYSISSQTDLTVYRSLPPSPTKWVITTLMPEKTIIYTPNPMPGIEKLLGAKS